MLLKWWDKLPQKWRDAAGRFAKVVSAAATTAAFAFILGHLKDGSFSIDPAAFWYAVATAAASAAEKFFGIAPKVAKRVRRKK